MGELTWSLKNNNPHLSSLPCSSENRHMGKDTGMAAGNSKRKKFQESKTLREGS